jgi:hypothetical protein
MANASPDLQPSAPPEKRRRAADSREAIPVRDGLSIRVPKMAQVELYDAKAPFLRLWFGQKSLKMSRLSARMVLLAQAI